MQCWKEEEEEEDEAEKARILRMDENMWCWIIKVLQICVREADEEEIVQVPLVTVVTLI